MIMANNGTAYPAMTDIPMIWDDPGVSPKHADFLVQKWDGWVYPHAWIYAFAS